MSEQPIEGVIGWTLSEFDGCWWDGDTFWHYRAEVDDLAAWLDSQFHWSGWDVLRDGDNWHVDFDNEYAPVGHTASLPTIREALIAAVRKVAGDE